MARRDPESAYIGKALTALEAEWGIPRRELVKKLGISYSHFSNLVTDQRPAGLPTIRKIAEQSGRAMAFFFGDVEASTTIGTRGSTGVVSMLVDEPISLPGLVRVEAAAGPFKPGDVLHISRGGWQRDRWGLVRERSCFVIAWMHEDQGVKVYTGFDGKTALVRADEVVGAVAAITTSAPMPSPDFLR